MSSCHRCNGNRQIPRGWVYHRSVRIKVGTLRPGWDGLILYDAVSLCPCWETRKGEESTTGMSSVRIFYQGVASSIPVPSGWLTAERRRTDPSSASTVIREDIRPSSAEPSRADYRADLTERPSFNTGWLSERNRASMVDRETGLPSSRR